MKKVSLFCLFMIFSVFGFGAETLTLPASLKEALENSPYLKIQERNKDAKSADVRIAWSAFVPHVQGEVGRGRQSKDNYYTKLQKKRFNDTGNAAIMSIDTSNPRDAAFWNITTKQDIFKGFGNYHNLKEKKKKLEMTELELAAERNNLIFDVISTYIEILNLQNTLDTLAKAKTSAQEQKNNLQKRYELQTVSKTDVEKAEEKHLEVEWKELEARQAMELAQNRMNQLLGRELTGNFKVAPLPIKNLTLQPIDFYLGRIPQNLEYKKTETEIQKDRFEKRRTYAQHLLMPNVGFEYNYEQRGERFTDLEEGWKLGVVARAPLFDGLENFGEQSKASAQLASAKLKSHLTKQSAEIGIKKHYYSFKALEKHIAHLKKKRDRQQRLFEDTLKALKEKAATLAQLHATEVLVLETDTQLLEKKRHQLLDTISLQKLTGEIDIHGLF
ncbi:MAG: TolC family protein [Deltaproteobacteria bacterium]|nr:TolC family protein [Deltaproteobacteria bacterium]